MALQSDAPFKFLVRPITTVNMSNKNLSWALEKEIFQGVRDSGLTASISGVLIIPPIIDKSIATPPRDYVGYQKSDNSMSVGLNIDFDLWERSSDLERLGLLVENIHTSLDMIQSRYLTPDEQKRLHLIVDDARVRLALRLQN